MNRTNIAARSRTFGLTAVAGFALFSGACATINYDAATVQNVVSMNRPAPVAAYERVGEFSTKQRPVFVISQLITVVDVNMERDIQRELQRTGGDAIINLRIHEEYDIVDVLIGLIVGGWVNTRSVELRGDVVSWRSAFLENGGAEWLAQSCQDVTVEDGDATRPGHICVQQDAPEGSTAGLSD